MAKRAAYELQEKKIAADPALPPGRSQMMNRVSSGGLSPTHRFQKMDQDHGFEIEKPAQQNGVKAAPPHRRRKSKLWTVCPFILVSEFCERLAYYSVSTNLVQYLLDILGFDLVTANNTTNNWSGACYLFPVLGAYIADSHLGRYNTIIIFSIIYILGLIGITLSSGVPALHDGGTSFSSQGFFIGCLYIIAIGTGGIKPCVSSFGADQFDESDPEELKEKSSFFNFFYWSINIGALIASLLVVNVQTKVSWTAGYIVPTVAFGLALAIFLAGSVLYVYVPPGGSAFKRIGEVLFASAVKCGVRPPKDPSQLFEVDDGMSSIKGSRKIVHSNQCLDKAATRRSPKVPGQQEKLLYTVTQVEEVKRMAGIVPIMIASIVFNTVYAQMSTVFVEQGLTMDLSMGPHFSITSASLSAFDTIAIIFLVPLYDRVIVPFLRRYNLAPTYLQRIGIGLIISTFSMVAASIVEVVRLRQVASLGLQNSTDPVPMSVFWLVPQYFIIGCAEIMVNIGTMECFYSEAPDAMRSLATSLYLVAAALGNYVATGVTEAVTAATTKNGSLGWLPNNLNQGRLDLYYVVLIIMSVLNVFYFLIVAHFYKYKQTAFTPVPNPEEGFSGVVDTLHGGLEVPKQERAGPAEHAQGA